MEIFQIITEGEDDFYIEAKSKRKARKIATEILKNKYKGVFYKRSPESKEYLYELGEIGFEIIEIIKLKIINRSRSKEA